MFLDPSLIASITANPSSARNLAGSLISALSSFKSNPAEKLPPTPCKISILAELSFSNVVMASVSFVAMCLVMMFRSSGRFKEIMVIAPYFSVTISSLLWIALICINGSDVP